MTCSRFFLGTARGTTRGERESVNLCEAGVYSRLSLASGVCNPPTSPLSPPLAHKNLHIFYLGLLVASRVASLRLLL